MTRRDDLNPSGPDPGPAPAAPPASPTIPEARTLDELCRLAATWGFLEPFRKAADRLRDRFAFWFRVAIGQLVLGFGPLLALQFAIPFLGFPAMMLVPPIQIAWLFLFAVPLMAVTGISATLEVELVPAPSARRVLFGKLGRVPSLLWLGILSYLVLLALMATTRQLARILGGGLAGFSGATSPWFGIAASTVLLFAGAVLFYRFVGGVCLAVPETVLSDHTGTRSLSHGLAMASSETTNLFAFQLLVNLVGAILQTQFQWLLQQLARAGTAGARLGLGFVSSPASIAFVLLALVGAWMLLDWWFAVWTYRYFWERGRESGLTPAHS